MQGLSLVDRAERFLPSEELFAFAHEKIAGRVENVSRSGIACLVNVAAGDVQRGTIIPSLHIKSRGRDVMVGPGTVARTYQKALADGSQHTVVAIAFEREHPELIDKLSDSLRPPSYVSSELNPAARSVPSTIDAREYALDHFYRKDDADVLAKCREFGGWVDDMVSRKIYQRLYRVTATSGLDNRFTVFDPVTRKERAMTCFDSNSYLGLHRHPKVIEAVSRTLHEVGYGSPSAQLLSGTNRHLRELEETISELNAREDTIVFPTGFAANVGTIQALVRADDAVIRDRHAHASIHEGCKASAGKFNKIFGHNNPASLDKILRHAANAGAQGKLVITDGVFSMHGRVAPLPELYSVCRTHEARLMVDDAHGLGVLGKNGGGIEEHFGMVGAVDVLMGTLSKSLGAMGGYVTGSRDLVNYLRWFAPSGLFTTSLPAATCAGITTALRLLRGEPQHRLRLWDNINTLAPALAEAGFIVPPPESPIITVFVGAQALMWQLSCELFDAGIKCGNVMYPAVGKSDCILRLTVNARHTQEDLDHLLSTLTRLGRKYDILGRSQAEIQEIGRSFARQDRPLSAAS
jgi:8-amino-7-oxononanoate synthase